MEDQVETKQELMEEDEIPKLRAPAATYAWAAAGILAILGVAGVMLYAWSQVL